MEKELVVKFSENQYDNFFCLCEQEKKEMSSYGSEIINDYFMIPLFQYLLFQLLFLFYKKHTIE